MKYLIIILIVLAVVWWATRSRSRAQVRDEKTAPDAHHPTAVEDMVTCAYCKVHLPKSEALPGRGGYFCDAAHRAAHEGREASP
jgi:uncharacterized protein